MVVFLSFDSVFSTVLHEVFLCIIVTLESEQHYVIKGHGVCCAIISKCVNSWQKLHYFLAVNFLSLNHHFWDWR